MFVLKRKTEKRPGSKCFIVLHHVQTVCPVGLRSLLQVTAPIKTSSTAASAAPTPPSRATDEEGAEEKTRRAEKTHYKFHSFQYLAGVKEYFPVMHHTSYLPESVCMSAAERAAVEEAVTPPSSPPAGWGPEQPSPPTANLEEDLLPIQK